MVYERESKRVAGMLLFKLMFFYFSLEMEEERVYNEASCHPFAPGSAPGGAASAAAAGSAAAGRPIPGSAPPPIMHRTR